MDSRLLKTSLRSLTIKPQGFRFSYLDIWENRNITFSLKLEISLSNTLGLVPELLIYFGNTYFLLTNFIINLEFFNLCIMPLSAHFSTFSLKKMNDIVAYVAELLKLYIRKYT